MSKRLSTKINTFVEIERIGALVVTLWTVICDINLPLRKNPGGPYRNLHTPALRIGTHFLLTRQQSLFHLSSLTHSLLRLTS